MMEGISHEAASLAGTWKLGKLVAFYDDNGISIDGHVQGWLTDDTPKRFEAYGWHVIAERRRPRRRRGRCRDQGRAGGDRQAVAPLLQDRSSARARPPRPAPSTCTAPRSARRKSRRRARRWMESSAVRDSASDLRSDGTRANAARCSSRRGTRSSPRIAPHFRSAPRNSCAASRANCRRRSQATGEGVRRRAGGEGRDGRHAQGVAAGDRGVCRGAAGDDRRIRGPHGLGVHQLVGQQGRGCRARSATT